MDAAGPNDVWAVGLYSANPAAEDHSLILHWDGASWSVVQHDCDTYGGLLGVTALSASNVWAVGDSETCHYDGSAWAEVPSPQPRGAYGEIAYPLEDVSGLHRTTSGPSAHASRTGYAVEWDAMTEHWDGSDWSIDFSPPAQVLYGVEALGPNNVWAVGTDSFGPIILRYDGTRWSTIATPEWGRGGRLAGIDSVVKLSVSSRGARQRELWAAGTYWPKRIEQDADSAASVADPGRRRRLDERLGCDVRGSGRRPGRSRPTTSATTRWAA